MSHLNMNLPLKCGHLSIQDTIYHVPKVSTIEGFHCCPLNIFVSFSFCGLPTVLNIVSCFLTRPFQADDPDFVGTVERFSSQLETYGGPGSQPPLQVEIETYRDFYQVSEAVWRREGRAKGNNTGC